MNSVVWKAVLVFSLSLNVAVAGTIGWRLWRAQQWLGDAGAPGTSMLFSGEAKHALQASDAPFSRQEMQEKRRLIQEKKSEILDMIAAHPGDLSPIQQHMDELSNLQKQMDTAALARISKIMAELPDEKRQQFLATLKKRTCRAPGMMGPCDAGHKGHKGAGHKGSRGRSMSPDPLFKSPPQE